MKKLIKLVVFVAVLAVAAIAAIYEFCPDSAAAKFIDPYCRDYYFAARERVVALYARCKGESGDAEQAESEEKPESAAKAEQAETPPVKKEAKRSEPKAEKPGSKRALEASLQETTEDKRQERLSLADAEWYTRRRVSERDCRGKAVVVCVWNSENPESLTMLQAAQRIADGFRGKPMVVFASHRGGDAESAKKILRKAVFDLPCCEGGGHPAEPRSAGKGPVFYLVDKAGKVKYFGRDDRSMTVRLVDIFSVVE